MNFRINNLCHNICCKKTQNHNYKPINVDDKLIRGHRTCNLNKLYQLKRSGVPQIIDLRNPATELSEYIPLFIEKFLSKLLNIKYNNIKYCHKLEKMPEMDFLKKINDKIVNNDGMTFIHCRHGKRRTGVCFAIYEKYHTNKSKDDILKELYNIGFRELKSNSDKIPQRVNKRLTKIYNNFIENFYPNESKIK